MAKAYEVMVVLSQGAYNAVRESVVADRNDQEYNGPLSPRDRKVWNRISTFKRTDNVDPLPSTVSGGELDGKNNARLVHFHVPPGVPAAALEAELLRMQGDSPGNLDIWAAWRGDGIPVGMDVDENGDLTGTPRYPMHAQTLEFFPIKNFDENGDPLPDTPRG